PSEVRCDVSGSSLVLSSVLNWFGNSSCVVRVFDGSGAFSDSAFFIEIKPVNDIPMFVFPFSDQNATVGITFTYDIDCYDVDNAIIYDDNTNLFNINPVSGMISFVPLNSTVGTYNIQINCSDVSTTISDSFKLIISTNTINNSVNNTNTTNNNTNTTNSSSSVLMNLTTIKTIYALQNFHYQINYSGLNHTTLFFSDDSSLFDVDSTTGIISFTPTISDIGIHESKILMRDGVLSKTETLILRILDYILPKCSDGLDNDDDGFIDMDDSGCSNPSDNQEFMIVDDIEDGLEFGKIRIFGFDFFMVERGDDLVVRAKIENTLNKKISGVSFGVLIPELGLKFKSNPFNIAARSDSSEELIIPIDECVVPGQYYVKVYVTNNKISKSEYYLIDVI
ncbi:MAG: hypothetical protein ABIC91_06500, partial [Nanoarchaeota archaeon]|nr:hypothetical protein [Nanoarchaeota archaeon]